MKVWMVVAMLAGVMSVGCGGRADIRPDEIKEQGVSASSAQRGEELIGQMLEAHGVSEWERHNFMVASVQDEWFNNLFFKLAAPYTENPEVARVASYIKRFPQARVEFLGGENAGEVWGVEGTTMRRKQVGEPVEQLEQAEEGLFASFVHNFLLWPNVPFQLGTADSFAYLGEERWEGRTYELVMLSWGGLEPRADVDQWIVWLDRETHLLGRVHFTVRLSGEGQVGVYNLRDVRDVQGMKVAHVYEGLLELDADPLHTYTYDAITFSNRVEQELMEGVD